MLVSLSCKIWVAFVCFATLRLFLVKKCRINRFDCRRHWHFDHNLMGSCLELDLGVDTLSKRSIFIISLNLALQVSSSFAKISLKVVLTLDF